MVAAHFLLNFRIELRLAAIEQTVACAACSILSEEAAASNFVARKVWPDSNDVEVAGSVRNKSLERRFPRRSGDETGMVVQCPGPARQAMDHAVMAIMLLSIAIHRPRPVLGREEPVSKHPDVTQRQ
jgi:hypothetical protein